MRTGVTGLLAVCAAKAGTMASRNGRAIVAPMPRSSARRERCENCATICLLRLSSSPHTKWTAVHNLVHQAHEPVILARNVTTNLIDHGLIGSLEASPQRIRHQFYRKIMSEERRIGFQNLFQPLRTADRAAVGQHA